MTRPVVTVIGAEVNRPHGHIALGVPGGPPIITLVDVGDQLHGWAYEAYALDPDGADALAAALADWAARRRPADGGPLPGQLDLFEAEP